MSTEFDLTKLSPVDRAILRQAKNDVEYNLALLYMESIDKIEKKSPSSSAEPCPEDKERISISDKSVKLNKPRRRIK